MKRIVCPACQAVYEVPDGALPAGGRDVQCSDCGHNWYQLSQGGEAPEAAPVPQPVPPVSVVAGRIAADRFDFGPAGDDLLDDPELDLPPPPPRRPIDPEVLAVLKAEAEHETRARAREMAAPMEHQPDLPLPPPAPKSELRERLARLKAAEATGAGARWTTGIDSPADPPEDRGAESGTGTALAGFPPLPPLPEGVSVDRPLRDRSRIAPSALEAPGVVGNLPAAPRAQALTFWEAPEVRRGFRIGFFLPVAAVVAVLGLYMAAPRLSAALPELAPTLRPVIEGGAALQADIAGAVRGFFAGSEG